MRGASRALAVVLLATAALLALAAQSARVAGVQGRTARPATSATSFPLVAILSYHDISDDPSAPLQTVSAQFLQDQIRACRAQGWSFLSLEQLIAAREHPERLPPRVMVLTFDDGYRSFAEQALPVLREEGVPATLSPITSYVGTSRPDMPALLSWAELRRLDARPDVDVASHSHAMHQYEPSNPHRDTGPAATTRLWLPEQGRYEDREEYRGRLGTDFAESQRVLGAQLGRPVRVLVWPYGRHNEMARAQAGLAGFTTTLSLETRPVTAADLREGCLPRVIVTRRLTFGDGTLSWLKVPPPAVRAAEVDLDELWNPNERVFRQRLEQTVFRARAMGATDVILPVLSDPRRDGHLLRAYAMNHQLPVLADVWSMAAAKFSAAGLRVWLRTPTMNMTWFWERRPEWRIQSPSRTPVVARWSTRLSPDLPPVRSAAVDLLTDLAVYLPIAGVVFDDDATMAARERLAGGGSSEPEAKSEAIRGLIEECKQAVRAWRPDCRFARSIPLAVVDREGVDRGTSVSLDECFSRDDYAFVPAPTGIWESNPWAVERLARRGVERWRAGEHAGEVPMVLMLAARDPRTHRWIDARRQQAMADAARRGGLTHVGTRPVLADGELPIGLLDGRVTAPAVRPAARY